MGGGLLVAKALVGYTSGGDHRLLAAVQQAQRRVADLEAQLARLARLRAEIDLLWMERRDVRLTALQVPRELAGKDRHG